MTAAVGAKHWDLSGKCEGLAPESMHQPGVTGISHLVVQNLCGRKRVHHYNGAAHDDRQLPHGFSMRRRHQAVWQLQDVQMSNAAGSEVEVVGRHALNHSEVLRPPPPPARAVVSHSFEQ